MKFAAVGLAAALLTMSPTSATFAQPQSREWGRADQTGSVGRQRRGVVVEGYGDYSRAPAARLCIPWCRGDLSPCDPPHFKTADSRCRWDD
jgi:hypothetical protein